MSLFSARGADFFNEMIFTTLLPTNPSVPIDAMAFVLMMFFTLLSIDISTSMIVSFIIEIFETVPMSIPANLTLLPVFKPCTFSNLALIT